MKIRRFFGKDMREALKLVKDELGSDAVIMSNRKVADGIELVAAYDKDPEPKITAPSANKPTMGNNRTAGGEKPLPTLSEIIGEDGPDSLRALLEKQKQAEAAPKQHVPDEEELSWLQQDNQTQAAMRPDPRPQQQSVEQPVQTSNAMPSDLNDIRDEIASLRNVLQFQMADLMESKQRQQRPMLRYLVQRLTDMGLSTSLAEQMVAYTPAELSERDAWVYLLKLLANRIQVNNNDILSHQGVVALVGPTGTGKTTTVAKLAARYAQKYGVESVAMITIDTYRIAAYEQLATYGKIIGCPVRKAQTAEELSEQLFQLRHKRLILIDTAGFSQRDSRLISQLKSLEQANGQMVRKYLVAQANTQYPALQRIVDAYDGMQLDGCIFTKLDECYSLGEIISTAIERQLSISYVTDGQQVPEDIKVADAKSLVSTAAKLYKKYSLNHTNENKAVSAARAV